MSYSIYKLIHLIAMVLWLGPALGAYWILVRANKYPDIKRLEIEKFYEEVLVIEHIAFLVLIATGFGIWSQLGISLFEVYWLNVKLTLVAMIVIIELFDISFSHFYFRHLMNKRYPFTADAWVSYFKVRKVFYNVAIPVLIALILGVLYLAVFKPL